MKAKYALIALLAITFFGCDDNTAGLGSEMFPDNDQNIKGRLSTFDVTTKSIETGQIYAKTNIGYVGKFTDETFGTYKAGFLAQLNCPDNLTFPGVYNGTTIDNKGNISNTMVKEPADDITLIYDNNNQVIGNIHTVEINLWYSSYFGDSLTASRLSVYQITKKDLDESSAYYTDIKPEDYYNESSDLLGRKAYTALDLSADRTSSTYVPGVHVSFSTEVANRIGGDILTAARTKSRLDNETFQNLFKGVYVKSDYGDGTVLYIDRVQMNVVYKAYATDTTGVILKKKIPEANGSFADSTYYGYRQFLSSREVIQANQLTNDPQKINSLIEQKNNTYLKSPAGIFTEATLPIAEIENRLKGDTLNSVKLTFASYNQTSDKKFGMAAPTDVVLVRKKIQNSFFENNQLVDGISSFWATHSTNQYTFSNITKLINTCIAEKEEAKRKAGNAWNEAQWLEDNKDWNKVILIPVLLSYDTSNANGQSNVIKIQHDLKPSYVRLKGGEAGETPEGEAYRLKLEVTSTDFGATTKANK